MDGRARCFLAALGLAAMLGAGCAAGPGPGDAAPGPRGRTFSRDTTLSGRMTVEGEWLVERGAVLTLSPGATLLFVPRDVDGDGFGDARLRVEGSVRCLGRPDAPVTLSSAGDGEGSRRPGDWDAVLINFSQGNVFRYTLVEHSRHGIHAHFSSGEISRSLLRDNREGCRLGNAEFLVSENLVRDNAQKGLNFRGCRNRVRRNVVTANGNGLFIFEKDAGSVIEENDIFANGRWDLRVDDFFTGVLATGVNWWGSPDEETVRLSVYDSRQDPEIGRVELAPAAAPFDPLSGLPWPAAWGEAR